MKKLLFITILCGCNSISPPTSETLIKEWVKQNTNDPSSYEPMSISRVDTIRPDFSNTEEGIRLHEKLIICKAKINDFEISLSVNKEFKDHFSADKLQSAIDILKHEQMKLEEEISANELIFNKKGDYNLYVIHDFRIKNPLGALMKHSYVFYFDSLKTSVVKAREATKMEVAIQSALN